MAETHSTASEMTLEQWADMDEDEPGELVDGRLEEEEMPTNLHELILIWLGTKLTDWLLPRGGLALPAEAKYAVRPRRGRKPDLSVFLPGSRFPRMSASICKTPPDIVIEVLSLRPRDQRRDRIDKMDDYAAFGVRWYWIVDPVQRIVEIYELDSDRRYKRVSAAAEGSLPAPGCDGLELPLDELWRYADRFVDAEPEPRAEREDD